VTVHRRSARDLLEEGRSRIVELLETVSGERGSVCGSKERSKLLLLNWRRCDDQLGSFPGTGPPPVPAPAPEPTPTPTFAPRPGAGAGEAE